MEDKIEIMRLLQEKQTLEQQLASLAYGSVEIRENNSNKYIYVHYREDGIALTKYVGEYSDDLYNLILNNSIKAKELKKQIKEIAKALKQLNYAEEELTYPVELNIDFAKRHLVDTIYKQAILEGVATTFADTESIIGRSISRSEAGSAECGLHNSSRLHYGCCGTVFHQFHVYRHTCRIYAECKLVRSYILTLKYVCGGADVFKSTSGAACYDSLFHIELAVPYLILKRVLHSPA